MPAVLATWLVEDESAGRFVFGMKGLKALDPGLYLLVRGKVELASGVQVPSLRT